MQEVGIVPLELEPLTAEPLVSVLMANYNYERYLPDALKSMTSQTYANWELIVCDDASTDNSRDVISDYAAHDDRLRLENHETNCGMAAALNTAFNVCSGQIVCLLDADDAFFENKLERVVEHFKHKPEVGLLTHPLTVIDHRSIRIQQIPFITDFEYGWIAEKVVKRGGRWRDMPTSALAFRREIADLSFPIPEESFQRFADGYLFTLMPLLTEVSAFEQPLAFYRVHGNNMLATLGVGTEKLEAEVETMQEQVHTVNNRLREFGCQCITISVSDNLSYRHKVFLLRLMQNTSWIENASEFWRVSRMTISDDLLGRAQKVTTVVVFAIALVLPSRLRHHWLNQTYGYSSLRYLIHRARTILRRTRSRQSFHSEDADCDAKLDGTSGSSR